ncbi:MAG: hypothetical protein H0T47_20985 [Planctomycetaceae bacterium]|nr:hypothetical protein [Planctomycetaceae bacterium]
MPETFARLGKTAQQFLNWPTVAVWNRLEGRTRAEDFDRSLKAEVRDALWMISRQWQMGEFIGDDAGSPVLAKVHLRTTQLNKYQAGTEPAVPLEQEIPLEAKVENQRIPFTQGGLDIALDLRLLMGRQWLKLITGFDPTLKGAYIAAYGIERPDPDAESSARICAHVKVWQQFASVAGRCMDGYALYEYLKTEATPPHRASDDMAGVTSESDRVVIDRLAERFVNWFEKLYYQPVDRNNLAWKPAYLEHQFACSAPIGGSEKVLAADEYYHGHLDWYNLDIAQDQTSLNLAAGAELPVATEGSITHTFIPTNAAFGGMPHPRYWTFENWKTDLSFVKPDMTDLNKLLLLDFILVFANDWFLVPFTLPVGTIAQVEGLMVTNVFGESTWVEAAGSGADEDWQRWNMYSMNVRGSEDVSADLSLAILPVCRKVLEGKPLEEVYLLRDEIANMVWAVEGQVPLANGKSKLGKEAGYELRASLQQQLDKTAQSPPEITYQADIRFQVLNTVPEEWIPLVPVHVEGSNREIQLQRAAMPRILQNDNRKPLKIEPRTSLMREGLESSPKRPYFIHEEEVSRAGIKLQKAFQRTRWYDGRVYTWLGTRKQVGRGSGSSGLTFDQIVPVEVRST